MDELSSCPSTHGLGNRATYDTLDIAGLIELCRQYDNRAWGELLKRYRSLVYHTINRKLASSPIRLRPCDADDIYQTVLETLLENDCKALRALKKPESLASWLVVVASNKTVDFLRRRRRRELLRSYTVSEPESAYITPPSESVEERELRELIRSYVVELPPLDQLVLKLFYEERLKYREIAGLLGLPINTVSTKLYRTKRVLLQRLKNSGILEALQNK